MSTLPATMQNAYLARGIRMTLQAGDNPAYLLATFMVMGGDRPDPLKICELAAWFDEPVEALPARRPEPLYVVTMGPRWLDEHEMEQIYNGAHE